MALFRLYYQAYRGLPRMVWLLAGLIFVNRCGTMVLPFLAIYLNKVQGLPTHFAVQFLAIYGAGGIVGAYLGGWLSQRIGAARVIVVSLVLSAPAYALIPVFDTTDAIAVTLLCLSIAAEMIRPAIATATSESSPPEILAQSFGLNRLAMNLGMSIGPAVGGVLAAHGMWFLLFAINGAFALLTALVALAFLDLRAIGDRPAEQDASDSGSPWSDTAFLLFLVIQAIGALVFFQVMSTLPVYLSEQYRLREDQIGALFVLNTALIVVFEMLLTHHLRRRPPLRLVAWGTGLVCLGFGGSVFGSGFAYAAALAAVWTFGEMLFAPFGITYAAQRAAGRNRAAYMGLNSVSFAVAGVGAPLVGGLLYRIDPQLPWWCCLGMAAVLPAGYLLLERRQASGERSA